MKTLWLVLILLMGICSDENLVAQTAQDSGLRVETRRYITGTRYTRPISYGTSFSKTGELYVGMENIVRVVISGIPETAISLEHSYPTEDVIVFDNWRPIHRKNGLELTHSYAADSGAYDSNQKTELKRHVDNNFAFWVKDFSIIPKKEGDFTFAVTFETDTAFITVGNLRLHTNPYPEPIYSIEFPDDEATLSQLMTIDSIVLTNLEDFIQAEQWFTVQKYTVHILNSDHVLIHDETVWSSQISAEAKKKFKKLKSGSVVVFQDIVTQRGSKGMVKVVVTNGEE